MPLLTGFEEIKSAVTSAIRNRDHWILLTDMKPVMDHLAFIGASLELLRGIPAKVGFVRYMVVKQHRQCELAFLLLPKDEVPYGKIEAILTILGAGGEPTDKDRENAGRTGIKVGKLKPDGTDAILLGDNAEMLSGFVAACARGEGFDPNQAAANN